MPTPICKIARLTGTVPFECLFGCKQDCKAKPYRRYSTKHPDQPVCNCGKGYGSLFDGLCMFCREQTAHDARRAHLKPPPWSPTSAEGFGDVED